MDELLRVPVLFPIGVGVLVAALLRVTNEFNIIARPLICVLCSSDTFISRLRIAPLAVHPRNTAAGGGWPSRGKDVAGTGTIPRACRAGSDATGSCTGIAPLG